MYLIIVKDIMVSSYKTYLASTHEIIWMYRFFAIQNKYYPDAFVTTIMKYKNWTSNKSYLFRTGNKLKKKLKIK